MFLVLFSGTNHMGGSAPSPGKTGAYIRIYLVMHLYYIHIHTYVCIYILLESISLYMCQAADLPHDPSALLDRRRALLDEQAKARIGALFQQRLARQKDLERP